MLPVGKFVRVGELRTDPENGLVHRYDGKEWISTVQEETVQDAPGEGEVPAEAVIPAEPAEDAVVDATVPPVAEAPKKNVPVPHSRNERKNK